MDGKMLAALARKLQEAINRNAWKGVGDAYLAMEMSLCDRRFRDVLEPLLSKELDDITESKERKLLEFLDHCALEKERTKALDKVSEVVRQKVEMKAREQRLKEQRKERERQQTIERQKAARKLEEKKKKDEKDRLEKAKEQQRALRKELARQRLRRRRGRDIIGAAIGGAGLAVLFSDSQLKENITTMPYSE